MSHNSEESSAQRFSCAVCGYDNLEEPQEWHVDNWTIYSYEICASCGFQPGFDLGEGRTVESYREKYIEGGCRWWSTNEAPPKNWDRAAQLARVGIKAP